MIRTTLAVLMSCASFACASPMHPEPVGPASAADFGVSEQVRAEIRWFDARARANPADTLAMSKLGSMLLRVARQTGEHEDFRAAGEAFERLRLANPLSVNAELGLAAACSGRHLFREGLEHARRAAVLAPGDDSVMATIGDLHLAMGNTAEAALIFDALAARSLTLDTLGRVALAREAEGRLDEAWGAMTDALRAGELLGAPPGQRAWCESMLGEFAFARGRLEEAMTRFGAALALAPEMSHAACRVAQIRVRMGEVGKGIDELAVLVKVHPSPRYWVALGDALLGRAGPGDALAADMYYGLAQEDMTGDLEAGDMGHARELVELWLVRGTNLEGAVELARRDLEQVRGDAEAYEVLGWAMYKGGRAEEGAGMLREAMLRCPGRARTAWRAGVVEEALGRHDEAARCFEMARGINPLVEREMVVAGVR